MTSMDEDKLNIYQRINAVMRDGTSYIQKLKAVESYKAVTHDQVTAEVRATFVANGIVIVPYIVSEQTVLTGTLTGKGAPFVRHEAVYDVHFHSVDDPGDFTTVRVAAHAIDHGDKAPGKSLSYAVKSAILKILMIETGESDESRIQRDDEGGEEGIGEKELADLLASIDAAATLEDLQTATKHALGIAAAGHDTASHKTIKAAGIKRAATFKQQTVQ